MFWYFGIVYGGGALVLLWAIVTFGSDAIELVIKKDIDLKHRFSLAILIVAAIASLILWYTPHNGSDDYVVVLVILACWVAALILNYLGRFIICIFSPSIDKKFVTACMNNNPTSDISKLIGAGANVNARGDDGKSALHYACIEGNLDILELLIKSNADMNILDRYGSYPLDFAVHHNHEKLIKVLEGHGAKRSI